MDTELTPQPPETGSTQPKYRPLGVAAGVLAIVGGLSGLVFLGMVNLGSGGGGDYLIVPKTMTKASPFLLAWAAVYAVGGFRTWTRPLLAAFCVVYAAITLYMIATILGEAF